VVYDGLGIRETGESGKRRGVEDDESALCDARGEENSGFPLGGGCISTSSTFSVHLPGDARELSWEYSKFESYEIEGAGLGFRESKNVR
jgi:hypothetical protein